MYETVRLSDAAAIVASGPGAQFVWRHTDLGVATALGFPPVVPDEYLLRNVMIMAATEIPTHQGGIPRGHRAQSNQPLLRDGTLH
jgi:hypothetical protein